MQEIISKYAHLLTTYCLKVKAGDRVYITSTYLAEPLLQELAKEIYIAGGLPHFNIELHGLQRTLMEYGNSDQLSYIHPMRRLAMDEFECYLNIRAPYEREDGEADKADKDKQKIFQQAQAGINKRYFERIGDGSMRRGLCQYPTQAGADDAGMTLAEYEHFVYQSCFLYDDDPTASWQKLGRTQQVYVDRLNRAETVQYRGPNIDITFSVKGRIWINSDGGSNMPSGEVFSAPVEDSMNGWVYFSYPTIYMGKDVSGIRLEVKDGLITHWTAEQGQDILDKVFAIEGARRWGEVAVGTNMNIQRTSRNILFDEKIGGSIHMAVGQAYKQCGGRNESTVHWDMITDMRNGGEIIADEEVIYRDGVFL